MLIPPDPLEGKNIIMEIRAGTGGDEAALFAADLFDMYKRYAEIKGWKMEILSSNQINLGGYKEIIVSICGKDVYGSLRWESGVHRVQRVPITENGGRIHTSAASVAVLPEAEETDVVIRDEDIRIDVMRAGGHGGNASIQPTAPYVSLISLQDWSSSSKTKKPIEEQEQSDAGTQGPFV